MIVVNSKTLGVGLANEIYMFPDNDVLSSYLGRTSSLAAIHNIYTHNKHHPYMFLHTGGPTIQVRTQHDVAVLLHFSHLKQ